VDICELFLSRSEVAEVVEYGVDICELFLSRSEVAEAFKQMSVSIFYLVSRSLMLWNGYL
jgi:hypothetical protein